MNGKLLRSELKSIVKECLVEILSEGLSGNQTSLKESYKTKDISKKTQTRKTRKKKLSYLDKIKVGNNNQKDRNIKTDLTDDPILNEILADTANSTLTEQIAAEGRDRNNHLVSVQGDSAARIVNSASPEDLFGDSADKWASLAFS